MKYSFDRLYQFSHRNFLPCFKHSIICTCLLNVKTIYLDKQSIVFLDYLYSIIKPPPPFKEGGAYYFAAARLSVGWLVHRQFPFVFFAEVACIEMEFGVQIYHNNVYRSSYILVTIKEF